MLLVNFPDFTTLKKITLAHLFQFTVCKKYSAHKKKNEVKIRFSTDFLLLSTVLELLSTILKCHLFVEIFIFNI